MRNSFDTFLTRQSTSSGDERQRSLLINYALNILVIQLGKFRIVERSGDIL